MRNSLRRTGDPAALDRMRPFMPPSLPGSTSLDRVSPQAPWKGYELRTVAIAGSPTGEKKAGETPRLVALRARVATAWNPFFLAGMAVVAVAVALGFALPPAENSRSYGFVAAGLAFVAVALMGRARFALVGPDPQSLVDAVLEIRRDLGDEAADAQGGLRARREAETRDALLQIVRSGDQMPARRRGSRAQGEDVRLADVTWRAQVQNRARDLEDDLKRARRHTGDKEREEYLIAAKAIELARDVAQYAPRRLSWRWLRRWTSGADVETAWWALHHAEAALTMVLPEETVLARLPDLRANLDATLAGDARLPGYVKQLDDLVERHEDKALDEQDREHIRAMTAACSSTSDTAHSNIRNYRNWLLIVSGVVTGAMVAVAFAHASDPGFLYIKAAGSTPGAGADVGEIEVAGAVGGLLMALFALIRLTVYTGPVALPLWQSLVRIPAGAAAGLVGALLLQGHLVSSIAPQARSGLLGYAVLFGAAPEILLRFLDKKVNEATAAARPKDNPLKSESGRSTHDKRA